MLSAAAFAPALPPAPASPGEGGIARLALLGSGTVGQAVLKRLEQWQGTARGEGLQLVFAANTRLALHDPAGLCPAFARAHLIEAPPMRAGANRARWLGLSAEAASES
jgi:homoserine dehydrogenase